MNDRASVARESPDACAIPPSSLVWPFVRYLADAFGCDAIADVASADWTPRDCRSALILCRDLRLLAGMQTAMRDAPVSVIVCEPHGGLQGPAALAALLAAHGLQVQAAGWAPADSESAARVLLAVADRSGRPQSSSTPADFRVQAFVQTCNESDLISRTLDYLTGQDIDVYVIDNWSTDDTVDRALEFTNRGLVGIESFPAGGPASTCDSRSILARIEELAARSDASWLMLHDTRERRQSPWRDVPLKPALLHVDRCGFTCVDHVVATFAPMAADAPDGDVEQLRDCYHLSDRTSHYHQRKVWKNLGCRVSLAPSAGHDVRFPARLVYPFKFLIKHYPVRPEAEGRRRLLSPAAFAEGPCTLERFDETDFLEHRVVERLSGVGVFQNAPPWATGPRDDA